MHGGKVKKRVNKSAAVVQQKAAKIQETDTPEQALHRALNYFPTPPWAARAGAEIIRELDPQAKVVWEPACGEGHMAEPLKEYFSTVHASDIHPHGYGDVADFLLLDTAPYQADWIITNPPFSHAAAFIQKGLRFSSRGVAMLLRVAFLEGAERYPLLYKSEYPLTVCSPFSERASMVLGQWDPDASSAVCMAWFFFRKFHSHRHEPPIIRPIGPGTESRLTKADDARRFAKMAPAPLFD